MTVAVKICGLKTPETLDAAVASGAAFVGFNFFPRTPRFVAPAEAARLAARVPDGVRRVGLVVDMDDAGLDAILEAVPLEIIQCHGGETPERVRAIRSRTGRAVVKAVAIAGPDDVARAETYVDAADMLLFDAKAPAGATRPGGNALRFDWELIRGRAWAKPWLLAGGLTPGNVAEAIRTSGAPGVDVSSGVEDAPGEKSVEKIEAFLRAVSEAARA